MLHFHFTKHKKTWKHVNFLKAKKHWEPYFLLVFIKELLAMESHSLEVVKEKKTTQSKADFAYSEITVIIGNAIHGQVLFMSLYLIKLWGGLLILPSSAVPSFSFSSNSISSSSNSSLSCFSSPFVIGLDISGFLKSISSSVFYNKLKINLHLNSNEELNTTATAS